MNQFSKLFGLSDNATQTVQQSAGNLQSVIDSTSVIAGGLQNISEEWMRFTQSRIEENLERLDDMIGCRNIQECLALQAEMVRDNFEALLHSAQRTSELSTKTASEAVSKMSDSTLAPR
jgi:phasin family protein